MAGCATEKEARFACYCLEFAQRVLEFYEWILSLVSPYNPIIYAITVAAEQQDFAACILYKEISGWKIRPSELLFLGEKVRSVKDVAKALKKLGKQLHLKDADRLLEKVNKQDLEILLEEKKRVALGIVAPALRQLEDEILLFHSLLYDYLIALWLKYRENFPVIFYQLKKCVKEIYEKLLNEQKEAIKKKLECVKAGNLLLARIFETIGEKKNLYKIFNKAAVVLEVFEHTLLQQLDISEPKNLAVLEAAAEHAVREHFELLKRSCEQAARVLRAYVRSIGSTAEIAECTAASALVLSAYNILASISRCSWKVLVALNTELAEEAKNYLQRVASTKPSKLYSPDPASVLAECYPELALEARLLRDHCTESVLV